MRARNDRKELLVRKRLIEAAEGRLDGVIDEFEHVFELLANHEKTVTVFGSARRPQDDQVTTGAYELSALFAKKGYAVVTGGGNGVMEAANRGAYDIGGDSIGFNILLPNEQKLNDYTTESFQFEHFFGRKVAMTLDASGYIFFAGGYGTLDELFEILALQQTMKIPRAPIVLFGSEFWEGIDGVIKKVLRDEFHTIADEDTDLYVITDDYSEAIRLVEKGIDE